MSFYHYLRGRAVRTWRGAVLAVLLLLRRYAGRRAVAGRRLSGRRAVLRVPGAGRGAVAAVAGLLRRRLVVGRTCGTGARG